jgi:hypothetical protein
LNKINILKRSADNFTVELSQKNNRKKFDKTIALIPATEDFLVKKNTVIHVNKVKLPTTEL